MKAPAFQWYPKDIETDEYVMLMDNRQFGAYVHLLNHGWIHGGIPSEIAAQAHLVKETSARWAKMWPLIAPCWQPHPSDPARLVNPRQERERTGQAKHKSERSDSGKRGAEKRWLSYATTDGSANGSANGSAMQQPMANDSSASASASAIRKKKIQKEKTHPPAHAGGARSFLPHNPRSDPKFDEFWNAVWCQQGKVAAQKAFAKVALTPAIANQIIAAAIKQGPSLLEHATRYKHSILLPRTWLDQGRYLDEPAPEPEPYRTPTFRPEDHDD
jgi:uncharacterized protein YdaU (DUF1376 family)